MLTELELPLPVTAKLSRKFYEVFGDELANELVEWFTRQRTEAASAAAGQPGGCPVSHGAA